MLTKVVRTADRRRISQSHEIRDELFARVSQWMCSYRRDPLDRFRDTLAIVCSPYVCWRTLQWMSTEYLELEYRLRIQLKRKNQNKMIYYFLALGGSFREWFLSQFSVILTSIDERVSPAEEARLCDIFIGVEAQSNTLIKWNSSARWNGPAITSTKRCLYQLGRILRSYLRVHIHVLVNTSVMIFFYSIYSILWKFERYRRLSCLIASIIGTILFIFAHKQTDCDTRLTKCGHASHTHARTVIEQRRHLDNRIFLLRFTLFC